MKTEYQKITEMNLRQLERLLSFKKLNFRDAYYVIMSDYPTRNGLANIVADSGIQANEEIIDRLVKEMRKLD